MTGNSKNMALDIGSVIYRGGYCHATFFMETAPASLNHPISEEPRGYLPLIDAKPKSCISHTRLGSFHLLSMCNAMVRGWYTRRLSFLVGEQDILKSAQRDLHC